MTDLFDDVLENKHIRQEVIKGALTSLSVAIDMAQIRTGRGGFWVWNQEGGHWSKEKNSPVIEKGSEDEVQASNLKPPEEEKKLSQ